MKISFYLLASVLVWWVMGYEISFPGVQIPVEAIVQTRRAHKYVEHQLNMYEQRRTSKYTLFLGIQNYGDILSELKTSILEGMRNYVSGNNNLMMGVGNIVIGSNNKLAGYNNWILTEKDVTSKEVDSNVLYIGRWRIKMDKIPEIEYRPEAAIQDMEQMDKDIIRNMRSMRDYKMFHHRNEARGWRH